jgi:chromosome partitioning protein
MLCFDLKASCSYDEGQPYRKYQNSKYMTKIISVAMQKGGVGKTTTAVNLSAGLAELGCRVLAIDLDPQGNLTQHVGHDPERISPTIYDVLKAELEGQPCDIHSCIVKTGEDFFLIPSQPELSLVELSLMNTLSRESILATILEEVNGDYDFIIIDCSPSLNLLVINALTAADSIIIPIQSEYLAARGASMILSTIETIRQRRLNPDLAIEGLLLTMADTRTNLARDVLAAVEQQFGPEQYIFPNIVRRSIRFAESAVAGQSILAYDPKNPGAEAYRQLAKEIAANNKQGDGVYG